MDVPVQLPPTGRMADYPAAVSIALGLIAVSLLLFVSSKFDPSGGALTIALIVLVAFGMALSVSIRYTIPQDPETAALVGGLVAAFGAVVAFFLGKPK